MECSKCKHWKNEQSELEYSKFYGICTHHNLKFSVARPRPTDVVVLDRDNITEKHMGVNRFENQSNVVPIGRAERSRYCFVTNEYFGCVNFEKR